MRNFNPGQLFRNAGGQLVPLGNFANHRTECRVVIRLFSAGIERTAKISGAGANSQRVRRSPMLYLVDGKVAFVEQWRPLPAKMKRQHCASAGHHDLTVGVVQLNIQLVSFKSAVVRKRQGEQAGADIVRYILVAHFEHKRRGDGCSGIQRHPGNHWSNPPAMFPALAASSLT
ncbi:hypothetical protein D1872_226770 [compost metagenome]